MQRFAWFISAHGFGHAARSVAIMNALTDLNSEIELEVFTKVPAWFFEDSMRSAYNLHFLNTDIGLVQRTAMEEDLAATLVRLSRWLPFDEFEVERLAVRLDDLGCDAVVADISPLGVAIAHAAGKPVILVENFTWDWIYAGYEPRNPGFGEFISMLEKLYAGVDLHIQTEPWCRDVPGAVKVGPVSRTPRTARSRTRQALEVAETAALVVVSMGGIPWDFGEIARLPSTDEVVLVVPGGAATERRSGSTILLPHRSRIYHPDLIHAADAVVGKLGYSTLAEVSAAGVKMGWIRRPDFPESEALARWATDNLSGFEVTGAELNDGRWVSRIRQLLQMAGGSAREINGADQAARAIVSFVACR